RAAGTRFSGNHTSAHWPSDCNPAWTKRRESGLRFTTNTQRAQRDNCLSVPSVTLWRTPLFDPSGRVSPSHPAATTSKGKASERNQSKRRRFGNCSQRCGEECIAPMVEGG